MRLYANTLKNYTDINNFYVSSEWHVREAEETTLHFRIVDLDRDGLRYISKGTVVTATVRFLSIDDAEEFELTATNPDSDDKSVWSITIPADKTPSSGNFVVSLTEDGTTKSFAVLQGIVTESVDTGGC